MAVRPIVIHGDPVLHRPARHVEAFDEELATLIADMIETNAAAHGAGLAAPQVGVGLRLFVWAMANDDDIPAEGVMVNPMLTLLNKVPEERPDPDSETEGCLSFPGESYPLKRSDRVRITGFTATGEPQEFVATGWFARCMQHEFDHLNGKLYVDRLDAKQTKKAKKAVRANGWGVPGNSWLPGVDPDPFGHDEDDHDHEGHDHHDHDHHEGHDHHDHDQPGHDHL